MHSESSVRHVTEPTSLTGATSDFDTVKYSDKCMFYIEDREGEKDESSGEEVGTSNCRGPRTCASGPIQAITGGPNQGIKVGQIELSFPLDSATIGGGLLSQEAVLLDEVLSSEQIAAIAYGLAPFAVRTV